MLTKRKLCVSAALALFMVIGRVLMYDGHGNRVAADGDVKATLKFPNSQNLPPAPPQPTWRGWRVNIAHELRDLEGDDPEKAEQAALADVLSRMTFEPEERVGHFKALDTPDYRLDGWRGSILSVEDSPAGVVVDLRVTPMVTCSRGTSTTVLGGLIERYVVGIDGNVRYLGSAEPPLGAFQGVIID